MISLSSSSPRSLLPSDAEWPVRFSHLEKRAPRFLFCRGTIPSLPGIAMVGTRLPSSYGLRATDHLVRECKDVPVCIISGLAVGIDGRVHEAALANKIPTVAILGSSVLPNEIFPPQHAKLAERIIAEGGAVVSEYAPGTRIYRKNFPERNRLIAALCHAIVVIEAQERSGTMITSRMALELGREVLAVPGSIFSPTSNGTHKLLASGARPCTSAHDIWQALAFEAPTIMHTTRTHLHTNAQDASLLEALACEPDGCSLEQLEELLKQPAETLVSRLGLLELQGLATQTSSGAWVGL